MASAHEGNDDRAFFHAAIERTYALLAVDAAGSQLPDTDGPLPSARYLIQVVNFSDPTSLCWLHMGPFVAGVPIGLGASAGKDRIPFAQGGLVAIEVNIIANHNDRVGAQTTAGTCDVYITRVSRTSRAGNP